MPVQQAQAVLARYWDRQLPVDPRKIAAAAGADVHGDWRMQSQDLSGSFDLENGKPTIRYNPADANVRQRFTIAHELGHMFLQHGRAMRDNARNYSSSIAMQRERDANSFAAELLMPREAVDWLLFKENVRDVSQMARVFNVSAAAMHYRLKNLGYLR